VDATATTEADGGRPSCNRAAAHGRLGRASDRARAWPVAQRDQRGARARPRHGRPLRRRAGTGRGGSAVGPVGTSGNARAGQPAVCRGGEAAAAAVVAGADRREAQAPGGWNGHVVRTTSEAIYQAIYAVPRGELRRELLACLRQGKPQRGRRSKDGERRGRICDMTSIRERPAEVEGAWTLGGRFDQGGRQPLLGRYAGPAARWS
jgi:hypothetical protein